jgi:uncharacterized membrane protein
MSVEKAAKLVISFGILNETQDLGARPSDQIGK